MAQLCQLNGSVLGTVLLQVCEAFHLKEAPDPTEWRDPFVHDHHLTVHGTHSDSLGFNWELWASSFRPWRIEFLGLEWWMAEKKNASRNKCIWSKSVCYKIIIALSTSTTHRIYLCKLSLSSLEYCVISNCQVTAPQVDCTKAALKGPSSGEEPTSSPAITAVRSFKVKTIGWK